MCDQLPEALFTASSLALYDLSDVLWDNLSLRSINDYFRRPLRGLAALHTAGFKQGEVYTRDVILIGSKPPESVLGDLGEAIKAEGASHTCLRPIHNRAPEVDGQTQYTNKIDVWSLGIVLLKIVNRNKHLRGRESPSVVWHQLLM